VLTKADSTLPGANSLWGETGDLPYGLYFIDHSGMQGPAGYQLQNVVALMGDIGGSEFGLYANTSAVLPNAHLDFVFVPFQVDSDGDGTDDTIEAAYGSEPSDATDHPRPTSAEGISAAVTQTTVPQLPNTGAGGSADGSLASIIVAALGAAALAIFGAVANRRRARPVPQVPPVWPALSPERARFMFIDPGPSGQARSCDSPPSCFAIA
jgi:hypothetical protein